MEFLVTIFLWICLELYMKYVEWKIRREEEKYQELLSKCCADFIKKLNSPQKTVKVDINDLEIMPTREV